MHQRKNFIPRNEGFACDQCGILVPPAPGTFRNHCPVCLNSKHVDDTLPGDRAAACGGLMPAIAVEGSNPSHFDLIHECVACGKMSRNRRADDDTYEAILTLIARY